MFNDSYFMKVMKPCIIWLKLVTNTPHFNGDSVRIQISDTRITTYTLFVEKKNNRATYFDDACGRRRLSNNFLFYRPLRTSDSSFCARIQRGFFREWHTKIMLFSNFRGKQTKLRVVTKVSGLEWSSVWEHDTWYERLQMLVIIVIVRWNVV